MAGAIPHLRRARFAEIITATQPYKIAIALAIQQDIPLNEITLGKNGVPTTPHQTRHLASITVENGTITAIGSALVDNITYILKPNADGSEFTVSGTCLEKGYCDA